MASLLAEAQDVMAQMMIVLGERDGKAVDALVVRFAARLGPSPKGTDDVGQTSRLAAA
jgi:hypothetical protein